jgi:hypothetical protein
MQPPSFIAIRRVRATLLILRNANEWRCAANPVIARALSARRRRQPFSVGPRLQQYCTVHAAGACSVWALARDLYRQLLPRSTGSWNRTPLGPVIENTLRAQRLDRQRIHRLHPQAEDTV